MVIAKKVKIIQELFLVFFPIIRAYTHYITRINFVTPIESYITTLKYYGYIWNFGFCTTIAYQLA